MKLSELMEDLSEKEIKEKIAEIRKLKASYHNSNIKPFGKYKIVNGKIEFLSKELTISNFMLDEGGELFAPFSSCAGSIVMTSMRLTSFKNFPLSVKGYGVDGVVDFGMHPSEGVKIRLWDGFPKVIGGNVNLTNTKFELLTYSKINNVIKEIKGALIINPLYKGPLLSTLLIRNLKAVDYRNSPPDSPISRATDIISAQLKGDKDIMEAREELLTDGLKEYARL